MRRCVSMLVCLCAWGPILHAQEPQLALDAAPMRLPPVDAAPAEVLPTPSNPTAEPAPADQSESAGKIVFEQPGWQVWEQSFWDPWEGSVEFGLSGTDGNSETFNVRLGVTAKHKTEWLVQTVQLTSIQKRANGTTTANTALLDGRLEWPMPQSRWNYFLHGLFEYDEFKAFDSRLSADTGFGYELIQNEVTTLVARSGLSVSQEIGGLNDETKPELLFGGEYKHKFSKTHSISAKVDAYPNISDFSDYRVNSQAAWEIVLAEAWGLSMKFSVIDRYDSTPQGAQPNDVDYSTLLLWTF